MKRKKSSRIQIAINGACGKMGRRLLALAATTPTFTVVGALEHDRHPLLGRLVRDLVPEIADDRLIVAADFPANAEVVIDFSTAASAVKCAKNALAAGCALVSGTTGLTTAQEAEIRAAAEIIPVIRAANYSLGVNLMLKIAAEMAAALGADFDIEITETHHHQKIDAPSGTALALAEKICAVTGRNPSRDLVNGRLGAVGARTRKEIGMHALRLGAVAGEHTIYFGSEFERLELTHRAENRDVFAAGALRAAAFLAEKPPKMYTMQDVLSGIS